MLLRDRECDNCHYQWTSPIIVRDGEVPEKCPECGHEEITSSAPLPNISDNTTIGELARLCKLFRINVFSARIYIHNTQGGDPYEADMKVSDQGRISGNTLGEALNKAMLLAAKKRKHLFHAKTGAVQVLEALKG